MASNPKNTRLGKYNSSEEMTEASAEGADKKLKLLQPPLVRDCSVGCWSGREKREIKVQHLEKKLHYLFKDWTKVISPEAWKTVVYLVDEDEFRRRALRLSALMSWKHKQLGDGTHTEHLKAYFHLFFSKTADAKAVEAVANTTEEKAYVQAFEKLQRQMNPKTPKGRVIRKFKTRGRQRLRY